jgi:hypothetical protein
MLSVVSSVSTRDVEGPGDCGSEVYVAEEVYGVGHNWVKRYHGITTCTLCQQSRIFQTSECFLQP